MKYAVLFPGQGSQFVGMGSDLFDAGSEFVLERADEVLGWSLRDLCLDGSEEELKQTDRTQPAIFAVSYALWSSFESRVSAHPAAAAGHSLGEYTALTASGALTFEEALSLVHTRGRLMAEAASETASGMAALLGADRKLAEAVVAGNHASGGTLQIANLNAPGQIVVAGSDMDLQWLAENGRDLGVRRAIPLKVAGAFHTSYMQTAADGLANVIGDVAISGTAFDVWANSTAQPMHAGGIAGILVDQVTSPVLFDETLQGMANEGIDTFVHVGPGDVTAGLAKRTLPEAEVLVASNLEDVTGIAESLSTMDLELR